LRDFAEQHKRDVDRDREIIEPPRDHGSPYSTRMLQRYIHPTDTLKLDALETGAYLVTNWSQNENEPARDGRLDEEIVELAKDFGGRQEARTPDLRVANAALSQLS
jgi:hypothetical protein